MLDDELSHCNCMILTEQTKTPYPMLRMMLFATRQLI